MGLHRTFEQNGLSQNSSLNFFDDQSVPIDYPYEVSICIGGFLFLQSGTSSCVVSHHPHRMLSKCDLL